MLPLLLCSYRRLNYQSLLNSVETAQIRTEPPHTHQSAVHRTEGCHIDESKTNRLSGTC